MQCQPLMIWRPVPDKSKFKLKVTGDESLFDVQMDIQPAGQPLTTMSHDDIMGGLAVVPINAGGQCTFDVLLNVLNTPAADKPVVVDIRIVDESNNVVMVSDGAGGTRPAQCASQFTQATGGTAVGIVVVAVAVTQ